MNENEMKRLLQNRRAAPSAELEARILSSVTPVLAERRELREARARRVTLGQRAARGAARAQTLAGLALEAMAFNPRAQAAGLAASIALAALLTLQGGQRGGSYGAVAGALPDHPKFNDVPARYDAQWRAERASYEKEVLDAHERYSGGL